MIDCGIGGEAMWYIVDKDCDVDHLYCGIVAIGCGLDWCNDHGKLSYRLMYMWCRIVDIDCHVDWCIAVLITVYCDIGGDLLWI